MSQNCCKKRLIKALKYKYLLNQKKFYLTIISKNQFKQLWNCFIYTSILLCNEKCFSNELCHKMKKWKIKTHNWVEKSRPAGPEYAPNVFNKYYEQIKEDFTS